MSRRSLTLVVLVLVTGCSQPDATTITSTTVQTTTTQQEPSTTAAPVLSEDVAMAFFAAWQAGDRPTMEHLSEPAALNEADSFVDLASESWEFDHCEGAAGTVFCSWTSEAGALAVGVRNIEEPHLVTSIRLLES